MEKVLFVCHYNVGRSQMAKAFYNAMMGGGAEAAGTVVDVPGQTLAERKQTSTSKNFYLLDAMNEVGINLSQATRQQLTAEMLAEYDLVVSMEKQEHTPQWLLTSPKYIYWDIPDPRGQDLEHTRQAREMIKEKVNELVERQQQVG